MQAGTSKSLVEIQLGDAVQKKPNLLLVLKTTTHSSAKVSCVKSSTSTSTIVHQLDVEYILCYGKPHSKRTSTPSTVAGPECKVNPLLVRTSLPRTGRILYKDGRICPYHFPSSQFSNKKVSSSHFYSALQLKQQHS